MTMYRQSIKALDIYLVIFIPTAASQMIKKVVSVLVSGKDHVLPQNNCSIHGYGICFSFANPRDKKFLATVGNRTLG